MCISRPLLVVLHVGYFILFWCETFVFVSPFCNEVVWSLKWICLWLDVSAALIWTLFRLFDGLYESWRMYDLGSAHLLVIVAGFHFPVWSSNIRTFCLGTSGGRSCAVLSWYIFCISCQYWKLLGLKLWQLSLILKCDCLKVQLDLEGCGWLVLFAKTALLS